MTHPIGTTLRVVLRFSGAATSPSGTLYANDSASGVTVTCAAGPTTDTVVATCSTSGRSVGDRLWISVAATVGGASETQVSTQREMVAAAVSTYAGGAVASVTGNVGGSVGSVASYGTLAADVATAVWSATTRSLTTFGTLVSDVVTGVWTATTRALTDKLGFGLSTAERDATAVRVEAHLLDEGDSQPLINAIVQMIGNSNVDQTALVAAIRADLERGGGNLATLLGRLTSTRAGLLENLDAAVSTRLPTTGYTAPNNAAIATAATNAAAAVSATDAATLAIVELTDAVNGLPGGGGGGGASAAEVWGYEDRLLTAYPSQVPSSVPIPGLGLYAAGAGVQAAARSGVAIEGQSIALLCRPLRVSGAYFTIATTASVTTLVVDEQATTPPPPAISHVPAEVIRNAPAIDGRWTEDGIGFNVDVPVAGSRLPRAGTSYRVTLRLTDTAGQSSVVRWLVQT